MCRQMPEFSYTDLLPLGQDSTDYRQVSAGGISTRQAFGRNFLEVDPGVLSLLTETAMRDIAHLLRPGHLRQLRSILDDPQSSANDRFVACDLLQNACIAAGGVLPMCQDTGTAIVMGKRGQQVLTDGRDEEHIARGVYDAYTTLNLRYSQLAPLTMWDERNTGSNLPAQIELYAIDGGEYKFLFMAKGGGSANKSYLYQETKAVLSPAAMGEFLPETEGGAPDPGVRGIDRPGPMSQTRAELPGYPIKPRLSLSGPMVVARDIAHAKISERLGRGEPMPGYLRDHAVYYAGPAKTPEGYASGSFGPTTAGRMDSYVDAFQAG